MPQWTPLSGLRDYLKILGRKMLFIAVGWVIIYWISQPFRHDGFNILMLFSPVVGALAGLVAGWYTATDSVEDSSLSGLQLRILIVLGAVLPMWLIEGLMSLLGASSNSGFGGWMILMFGSITALAAAVWHESSQE